MSEPDESQPKRPRIEDNDEGDSAHSQDVAEEIDQRNAVDNQEDQVLQLTDHLSALIPDLAEEVVSHLNFKDCRELECLSKHWCALINNTVLKENQKEDCGDLMIYQVQSLRHFFALNFSEAADVNCYRYSVHGNPSRNTTFPHGRRFNTKVAQANFDEDIINIRHTKPGTSTTIPTILWQNLEELLKTRSWKRTTFLNLLIDDAFCDQSSRVLKALKKKSDNEFAFRGPIFDDALDVKKFQQFLLNSNLTALQIAMRQTENTTAFAKIAEIFTEPFLMRFSEAATNKTFTFYAWSSVSDAVTVTSHWVPSKEFLDVLHRFESFHLPTMKVDPEAFVEIVKKVWDMQDSGDDFYYLYSSSLTEEIQSHHMRFFERNNLDYFIDNSARDALMNDIEEEEKTVDWWTVKGRKVGRMGEKFAVHFYQVEIAPSQWLVFINTSP